MRSFGSCSSGMFEGEGKETDIWPSSVLPNVVHDAMVQKAYTCTCMVHVAETLPPRSLPPRKIAGARPRPNLFMYISSGPVHIGAALISLRSSDMIEDGRQLVCY